MKLISMVDFVFLMRENNEKDNIRRFWACERYAKFLKNHLTLGMFVPCDDEGNVFEQPIYTTNHSDECYCKGCEEETKRCSDLQYQYQKAKEKVLFIHTKEICYSGLFFDTFKNIEDLLKINYSEFNLTENALKQIGL